MGHPEKHTQELKREERKLNRFKKTMHKKVLKEIFESHQAIMLMTDLESGQIIDANLAAVNFYKYSKEKLLTLNENDINALSLNEIKKAQEKILKNKQEHFLFPHKLADGSIRQVEIYSSLFEYAQKPASFSIILDITDRIVVEDKLRKNEEKFVSAFRSNPNAIVISNFEDGKIYNVNDAFFELTGLSRKDIEGQTTVTANLYKNPDDRNKILNKLKQSNSIRNYETKWRHTSGEIRTILLSSELVKNGRKKRIVTTILDITQREQLKQELERNNALLQAIFDSVPAMITVYTPSLQKIEFNKEFERITGWTKQDLESNSLMELVYPDPEYRNMATEFMQSLQQGFKDFVITGKNGEKIESIWANVQLDDGRQVGIGIDIRKRRKAQKEREQLLEQLARDKQALAESEERYRIMGESIDYGVWAADTQGNATYISNSFCNLVGKTFEELQKLGWTNCLIPEQQKEVKGLWLEAVKRERRFEHEHKILSKNGEIKTLLSIGMPVFDEKKQLISWAGINLDITERKNIEKELKEKNNHLTNINEVLDDFVKIAAHDLRSPIHNLIEINELIRHQTNTHEKLSLLDLLDPITKRLQQTVESLMETVSIQTQNKQPVALISFSQIWQTVSDDLSNQIQNYDGKIEVNFDKKIKIKYIEVYLVSILRNLISNAIKYSTKNKNPFIKISTRKKEKYILLTIEDNGIGIDIDKVGSELFKPFKRFTSKAEGTGMGLYIVKNIVERNGGNIRVESEINKGTTFYCYLKEYLLD